MSTPRRGIALPTPEPAWNVQIVTPVCLVEGQLRISKRHWSTLLQHDASLLLTLTAAQLLTVSDTAMMPRTISRWTMPLTSLIAFIPRDEASSAAVEHALAAYEQTSLVVIYAGPYRIRASVLGDGAEALAVPWMVARDAELTPLPERTHSARIRARLLLLSQFWVHGYHNA